MGLLVLFITKVGGSMMVVYYSLKLVIWYLPFAVQAHTISFTSRDTMDVPLLIFLADQIDHFSRPFHGPYCLSPN